MMQLFRYYHSLVCDDKRFTGWWNVHLLGLFVGLSVCFDTNDVNSNVHFIRNRLKKKVMEMNEKLMTGIRFRSASTGIHLEALEFNSIETRLFNRTRCWNPSWFQQRWRSCSNELDTNWLGKREKETNKVINPCDSLKVPTATSFLLLSCCSAPSVVNMFTQSGASKAFSLSVTISNGLTTSELVFEMHLQLSMLINKVNKVKAASVL